ncbi:MAG: polysaccharide biosynthesis protein [Propionibacteriaceae bacterium]|nr:polysaccharide biosynthesis protein [Propionibacteriaceae bacterium]
MQVPVVVRRMLIVAWDVASWLLAFLMFVVLRYNGSLTDVQWVSGWTYTALAILLQVVGGIISQIYLGRSRVGSFSEATMLGGSVAAIAIFLGVAFAIAHPAFPPRSFALAIPLLALTLMAAGRWAFRIVFRHELRRGTGGEALAALVYGAGDAGHQVARLVDNAAPAPYRIVGFVDDDPGKGYLRVRGYRVLGPGRDAVELARAQNAELVILAISNPKTSLIQELSDRCTEAGLKLVVVPPVREMIGGRVTLGQLREFNVADLLGRRPVKTDLHEIAGYVTGKVVLVTGAGGSIGSELARQVRRLGPAKLILLDRDESALHAVQLSLYGSGLLDTDDMALCSIRDHAALQQIFEAHRPDVVFHAAALKHLPMLELYPEEGWKTNVLGTLNVLRCAHAVGVRHFVNISTDKAADATSVLGQTKRLAERLTAWYAQHYSHNYLSVRFGNVLGSRGSVLYTFKAQIERGGPVTVTHPDVTRFFMTIPEACELVLQAGAIGKPGDVLVLDMGEPVKIVDVASRLIAESGRQVEIEYTGLRRGEKLDEVLLSSVEHGAASEHPLITRVVVPPLSPSEVLLDPNEPLEAGNLMRRQSNDGSAEPGPNGAPTALYEAVAK